MDEDTTRDQENLPPPRGDIMDTTRKSKHTEITEAYPRQIFIDQIKDVACGFCQDLPRNAKQCSNGCLFCSLCVNAAVQAGFGNAFFDQ